jgi:hypothetical protein
VSRKAKKFSKAKATIEASLEIAQEHARLVASILDRNHDTTERAITDLELTHLPTSTAVTQ